MRVAKGWKIGAALGAAGLLLPSAIALAAPAAIKARAPAISFSFDRFATFTPAQGDPRLAASFANRPTMAGDFHFTPSAARGRPSQLRVAIRARAQTPAEVVRGRDMNAPLNTGLTALTPASYNLGVAVGWKRFAVSGDVARSSAPNPALGSREGAVLGVSYNLNRFTPRIAASADRSTGKQAVALGDQQNYAVDLGTDYRLSQRLSLTGGVRYKVERDRVALSDERRDSQAVYIGTAFKF
ncbi:porin [Sphingomonas ginkgonis]|uniref:Porin n=1 Tax=Sphingomonas ginkgonis TaxID=2315330 RepID=A0A429V741_9SPHN|nr:porin [Sphingomonas ginkgonis]RST29745.1 porin [Sphingomonas ginkgonis]